MPVSQQEALAALRDIAQVEDRATQARSYGQASPHFVIWGLVTLVCYGLADLLPPAEVNWVWMVGSLLGIAGSAYVGGQAGKSTDAWRSLGVFVALVGFVVATGLILPPTGPNAGSAFVSLVVAVGYVLMGIWRGIRILLTGLALAALTLGGYFTIAQHFQLYMGVVTGGALILAGLWLRRV